MLITIMIIIYLVIYYYHLNLILKVILKDLLNAGYIEKVKQSNIEEIKNNEEANEEESEYNED